MFCDLLARTLFSPTELRHQHRVTAVFGAPAVIVILLRTRNGGHVMAAEEFYFYTKGMSVGYGGVPLIRDIELKVRRGEILTLIGPNGAGKRTTILRSIIRQLSLIGGAVYLDGRDIRDFTGNELARRLSVVLTERARPELMTCEDVVSTGLLSLYRTFWPVK